MARFSLQLISFSIFLILLIGITQARYSSQLKVQLNHGGELIGRHITSHYGRNVRAFLGIPYAKPPVGDLRFRAPLAADSWSGERLAIKDAQICSQWDKFSGIGYFGIEDCLYLNVYTPEEPKNKEPLPVMVWIHGGGYVVGSGSSSEYNPKFFMDRDIVLVSINYRLGTLGFLSSETLDIPGNFGLKDQNLALKWVQEHISAFGGNPESVTIFGESAGSGSVTCHIFSEISKGLFQKAIAQSGTVFNSWSIPATQGIPSKQARKLAKIVGCDSNIDSWSTTLDCLRTVPAQNLTEAEKEYIEWDFLPVNPFQIVVEPEHEEAFFTQSPQHTEYSNSIPLMIGFTVDEGLFFVGKHLENEEKFSQFEKDVENLTPLIIGYSHSPKEHQTLIKQQIFDFYLKNGFDRENYQNLTDVFTDSWFISGIDQHLEGRMSEENNGASTYLYQFAHKGFASETDLAGSDKIYGTSHGDDLLYLFPWTEQILPSISPSKRDRELTDILLDLWYNFAATSNPTPENTYLPKWSPVETYPPKSMYIGSRSEDEPLLHFTDEYPVSRANFWRNLRPYLEPTQTTSDHEEL